MPARRKILAASLLTLSVSSLPAAAIEPVNAVSTIGMLADVVANVGGECVDSAALMGPGVDPHLYQATARDVRTFQTADVIFYSGYHLEGQLADVLERLARRVDTLGVSEAAIPEDEIIRVQNGYGLDPHVWMDPGLWAKTVPVIAAKLAELNPDCADQIAANAAAYGEQIAALDAWATQATATIPQHHRILVTAHDAFNYFGRAYGIEVAGIQGISTESEAGVADIRHMAEMVAERGVPAVFVESTINPRTIQAVLDAAARQGHKIRIGAQLYSDAMGETGTPGGTYIGMIYENTSNITKALGGTPPPLPAALAGWAERWDIAMLGE
jgi:manganese/zinc/iron transport system substrate-binding protein